MRLFITKHKWLILLSFAAFFLVPHFLYAQNPLEVISDYTNPVVWILKVLEGITWVVYKFFWLLAQIASAIMALSLKYTVFEMGDWVNQLSSLRIVWTIFRDFANLSFIFILLWAAISIILDRSTGGDSVGKILSKLVVVAVLINFSFFFVGFIYDVSNFLSFEIYNSVTVRQASSTSDSAVTYDDVTTERLTTAIINMSETVRVDTMKIENSGQTMAVGMFNNNNTANESIQKIMRNIMSAILMVVLAFVFASAAIMLLYRLAYAFFGMVVSPIMLAAWILPQTRKYTKTFIQDQVLKQAFWVPIFMFCLYIGLQVMADKNFMGTVMSTAAASGPLGMFAGYLLNYGLVMAFFLGSLVVAKKMGAAGVDRATELVGGGMSSGTAWMGRNTVGRMAASRLRNGREEELRNQAAQGGMRGYLATKQLKNLESWRDKKYDFRNTRAGKLSQNDKYGFNLGKATDKNFQSVKSDKEKRDAAALQTLEKADAPQNKAFKDGQEKDKSTHEASLKQQEKDINDDSKTRLDGLSTGPEAQRFDHQISRLDEQEGALNKADNDQTIKEKGLQDEINSLNTKIKDPKTPPAARTAAKRDLSKKRQDLVAIKDAGVIAKKENDQKRNQIKAQRDRLKKDKDAFLKKRADAIRSEAEEKLAQIKKDRKTFDDNQKAEAADYNRNTRAGRYRTKRDRRTPLQFIHSNKYSKTVQANMSNVIAQDEANIQQLEQLSLERDLTVAESMALAGYKTQRATGEAFISLMGKGNYTKQDVAERRSDAANIEHAQSRISQGNRKLREAKQNVYVANKTTGSSIEAQRAVSEAEAELANAERDLQQAKITRKQNNRKHQVTRRGTRTFVNQDRRDVNTKKSKSEEREELRQKLKKTEEEIEAEKNGGKPDPKANKDK